MTDGYYRGWIPPDGAHTNESTSGLRIYNSLTDRKEFFFPKGGPGSKKITWYSCGPTVYGSAHMGHSRNYVTIDINRRILEDYFGYTILFVMNITDVEDKIVSSARRSYLLKRYQQQSTEVSQVKRDADAALADCVRGQESAVIALEGQIREANAAKLLAEASIQQSGEGQREQHQQWRKKVRQIEAMEDNLRTDQHKLSRLQTIQKKLESEYTDAVRLAENRDVAGGVQLLVSTAGEQLALWLDHLHKAEVLDDKIYRRYSEHFEREFWHDMDLLGTRRPTVLTRVTEYMPQIVEYIQRIMENGFAYTSLTEEPSANAVANGSPSAPGRDRSVYFDTTAFEQSGHLYPKLNPWAAGSTVLAADGEANFVTHEKRNPKDFALWKAAKPGEPSWQSPWGRGRPGWHIECSAMASSIIGQKVDIHTGGEDLRFPHHDNELAQAEAYYHKECGCKAQWVNYFMHSGHLCIDGLKMSKSTKNFITIREALEDFSARQLRLMFAMTPWNKEMTFGKTMREEMRAKERVFKHFFQNVDVLLRRHTPLLAMEALEEELDQAIDEAKESVHECLTDNLNTSGAIEGLLKLVAATNKYMKQREVDLATVPPGPAPHPYLLRESARFVTHILRVFGISKAGLDGIGFGGSGLKVSSDELLQVFRTFRESLASSPEMDAICSKVDLKSPCELSSGSPAHVLDALTEFRTAVRDCAKKHKLRHVLEECDRIRDKTMADLGIRMEDRPDGSSVWMAEDPEELQAERRERESAARAAYVLKRRKTLEERERLEAKLKKLEKLPTVQEALGAAYSRFDGAGQEANPSHDAHGNELSAEALKKGKAAADKARKPRAFLDKQVQEKGPRLLQELAAEIDAIKREIQQIDP